MKARKSTLAILAVAAVTVPSLTASTAAWNDTEWVHGEALGTDSMICGVDQDFDAAASGRFLSGELVGLDLDTVASLKGMDLTLAGGSLTVDPPGAQNLGATPPTYAYANPLVLGVIGDVVTLDLTGLGVGLPDGSAGAVNQYARVSGFGDDTAGAAGLVTNSGAVMVTPTTPDDELPDPARITLAPLLTGVLGPGVVDAVDLEVGAVASSSVLDGCEALVSQVWGDGLISGSTRDYGIASLGLNVDAPVVGDLVSTVNAGVGTIGAAVDSLLGSSGLISNAILADLELALPGVLTTAVTGNVTLSGLDLPGAVSTLLTTPLTDGVVTVDLQVGTVDVDLDALLGSLNEQAPNTELVLNDTVLNPIITRAGALLDAWTTQIVNALTQELREATLTIALSAVVSAPGVPPLLPGLDVLDVSIGYTGTVGAVLDGTASFAISAEAAGVVSTINTLLAALGLPTVDDLITTVNGLSSTLVTSVANAITTTAVGAITTLGSQLATATTELVSLLSSIVGALPNVVSLMVNVQPDQPGAPPGSAYLPGTDSSTPEYTVSALRIGLVDALGSVAHVLFATSTAGPVSR